MSSRLIPAMEGFCGDEACGAPSEPLACLPNDEKLAPLGEDVGDEMDGRGGVRLGDSLLLVCGKF